MPKKSDKLTRLLEQERELQEAIKEAKKEQAKNEAALHRKRCGVIGLAVAAEMEENASFAADVEALLLRRVSSARDRKLLNLPPLKKEEKTPALAPVEAAQNG